jgi:hypothetical protein
MKRSALCSLAFSLLIFSAKKDLDWKTGKVTDPFAETGQDQRAIGRPDHSTGDPHIVTIQGTDSIYTVQERHAWNSWCLLIAGDEIKYAKDKRSLYLVDSTGAKCKFDLVKEEKSQ